MSDTTRWARIVMILGAVLLATALTLTLLDLSADDTGDEPVPVTGAVDTP